MNSISIYIETIISKGLRHLCPNCGRLHDENDKLHNGKLHNDKLHNDKLHTRSSLQDARRNSTPEFPGMLDSIGGWVASTTSH